MPLYAGTIINPKAWLTRLAHNLCMDLHRERQRTTISFEVVEEIAQDYENLFARVESPDAVMLRRELAVLIDQAISALPTHLQTPFVLRFCQDKSYVEIAEHLDISLVNARKRIQQARSHLQKSLRPYMAGLNKKLFTIRWLDRHKDRSEK